MRKAYVYRNDRLAGTLTETDHHTYVFRYEDAYYSDETAPAISLTLPATQQEYQSDHLFPFFFNMISEGVNRRLQCRMLKIDEKDFFGILIQTGGSDTIGAVKVVDHEQ